MNLAMKFSSNDKQSRKPFLVIFYCKASVIEPHGEREWIERHAGKKKLILILHYTAVIICCWCSSKNEVRSLSALLSKIQNKPLVCSCTVSQTAL